MRDNQDVDEFDHSALKQEIVALREAIRNHRNQMGDDRCWLDDDLLYQSLPETPTAIAGLPPRDIFLAKCQRFHEARQSPKANISKGQKSNHGSLDCDLDRLTKSALQNELLRLRASLRQHREAGESQRTWLDDEKLYATLPDDISAITVLPDKPEFLASCKRFYATRGKPPNLHQW